MTTKARTMNPIDDQDSDHETPELSTGERMQDQAQLADAGDQDTPDPLHAALSNAFDDVVPPPTDPQEAHYDAGGMEQAAADASGDEDEQSAADGEEDDDDAGDGDGDGDAESETEDEPMGDEEHATEDDPEEAARLAALASDLDDEPADEAVEGEISLDLLDEDALKVVRRLHHFGYEAYLVGGCVRDTLLGRKPKDFDIATSAEPNQIRQTFRNCRLIGRRFRLAHVYFQGGKTIETSTFRANPLDEMDNLPQDLLISQDNVFGSSEEDARRRDFTINALFYDPKTGKVLDHVGGRADLDARLIRTIGDPDVRLREDPVRILRAVKFAARLGFDLDGRTRDAMTSAASEISRCAAPRVLEEIYRLLACGSARHAFSLLMDLGIFPVLMPEVSPALGFNPDGTPPNEEQMALRTEVLDVLGAMDAIKERGVEPTHALSLGALFLRLFIKLQAANQDANKWLDDISSALVTRLRLTRRDRERLRMLMQAQRHLAPERRKGSAARATVRRGPFLEALLLYTLELHSRGADLAEVGHWKALARAEGALFRPGEVTERGSRDRDDADSGRDGAARRRGRRRRRRR